MYPKILNTKENLSQEKKRKKEHQNKKQEFIIQIFFYLGRAMENRLSQAVHMSCPVGQE